jgi:putative ABC transport system permease protein
MKTPLFETFVRDVRVALRALLKSPGFAGVVVISLALGIAANSTIYSVLNAELFRPLPYRDSNRLVAMWQTEQARPDDRQAPPIAENVDWNKQTHVFEDIALTSERDDVAVAGLGEPRTLRTQYVSPDFFEVLGARPILGRVFEAGEAQDWSQTVVISEEFWNREFHRDPGVLGKSFSLEEVVSTVVGVMPAKFAPFYGGRIDVWQPINPASGRYTARFDHWLMPVGRLKNGVTIAQAQSEMDVIASRMEQEHPQTNKGWGVKVFGLHEDLYRWAGPALYPLLGAVAFVLLIACVNVANLMQFRTETRKKEFALRVSLGARRGRLIQQLLTESGLLAVAGGLLGIVLTVVGIKLFLGLAGGNFPNADSIRVDGRVLLFTLGISLATALLVGLLPAVQASRMDLNVVLREGERKTTNAGSLWARNVLAVCEMALAMVLLAGAGLMINTVLHLQQVDPGFDVNNLMTMEMQLPEGGKYLRRVPGGDMENPLPTVTAFYRSVVEKVRALPGVESAAVMGALPMRCCAENYSFAIVGKPAPEAENRPFAGYSEVSTNAFETLKVPLLRGRLLDQHDTESGPWVIAVNDAFAKKYFPNEDPIGQQILLRYDPYPVDEERPRQIVGVVGNVKQFGLGREAPPFVYAPFEQQPAMFPGGTARAHLHKALIVRASEGQLKSASLVASMKGAVGEADANLPVTNVMAMREVLSRSLGDFRAYMQLLGIFAGMAVLLAAVGIYGVMSYSVNERTHEFGIRLALGAQEGDILKLVGKLMLKLTLIGIVIGVGLAAGLMRLISAFLFGVKPTDPLTYLVVAVFLALIAVAACYLPVKRATRVDPLVALRYE